MTEIWHCYHTRFYQYYNAIQMQKYLDNDDKTEQILWQIDREHKDWCTDAFAAKNNWNWAFNWCQKVEYKIVRKRRKTRAKRTKIMLYTKSWDCFNSESDSEIFFLMILHSDNVFDVATESLVHISLICKDSSRLFFIFYIILLKYLCC